MAADHTERDADRKRIDVGQIHEVAYWSEKFGVRPEELRQAVAAAGPVVDDVARHLGKGAQEAVTATTGRLAGKASSGSSLREKAQRTAHDVRDFAAAKGREVRQVTEDVVDETMRFIAKRPVVSVLIGVAFGYALGWLAGGAVRHEVEKRRRAAAARRAPHIHEKRLRISEWPRRGRARQ